MGHKRKSKSVVKFSEEKRKALSWHFLDSPEGSSTSSIHLEPGETQCTTSEEQATAPDDEIENGPGPPFHITKSVYQSLRDQCEFGVRVFHQGYSECRADTLGSVFILKLKLCEYSCWNGFTPDNKQNVVNLPDTLPPEPAVLMVSSNFGSPCFLIFDHETSSPATSEESSSQKRSFTCFEASFEKDQALSFPTESVGYLCRVNRGTRMRLEVTYFNRQESSVVINVYLLKGILSDLKGPSNFPSQSHKAKQDRQHLQLLLAFCYGFHFPAPANFHKLRRLNLAEVFQHVYEAHREESPVREGRHVQHEKLIPTLRPYQVDAVRWMIEKETDTLSTQDQENDLHELWRPLTTLEGKTLYYNPLSAEISAKPFFRLPPSPGGILADEMGLGKTVEMLACILNHPRPRDLPQINISSDAGTGSATGYSGCLAGSSGNQNFPESSVESSGGSWQRSQRDDRVFNQESGSSTVNEMSKIDMSTDSPDKSAIAMCNPSSPITSEMDNVVKNSHSVCEMSKDECAETVPPSHESGDSKVDHCVDKEERSRKHEGGGAVQEWMIGDSSERKRSLKTSIEDQSVMHQRIPSSDEAANQHNSESGKESRYQNATTLELGVPTNSQERQVGEGCAVDLKICEVLPVNGDLAIPPSASLKVTENIERESRGSEALRCQDGDFSLTQENSGLSLEFDGKLRHTSLGNGQSLDCTSGDLYIATGKEVKNGSVAMLEVSPVLDNNVFNGVVKNVPSANGCNFGGQREVPQNRVDGLEQQEEAQVGIPVQEQVSHCCGGMRELISGEKPCDSHLPVPTIHQSPGTPEIPSPLKDLSRSCYSEEADRLQVVPIATVTKDTLTLDNKEIQMAEVEGDDMEKDVGSISKVKDSQTRNCVTMETGNFQSPVSEVKYTPNERCTALETISDIASQKEFGPSNGHVSESEVSVKHQMTEDDIVIEEDAGGPLSPSCESGKKKSRNKKSKKLVEADSAEGSAEFDEVTLNIKFSCLCGKTERDKASKSIQCRDCLSWQHAKCVNWHHANVGVVSPSMVEYRCPHCQVKQAPVKSSATLIISPSSISQQWVDEINHHVRSNSLKILVYKGVKFHRFLQPNYLAQQDIVITTYDVLKTELNYVDLPHCNSSEERKLRHNKRYMAVPSPLPAVEWWRVCLDEAQKVECPTAKSAEMALHLSAVNRWCVTGTPVQTGLNDLYGLFLFLNEDPYRTKFWWDHALCAPFANGDREPMLKALTKKLWRTAKKDVLDQINIPSQTEEVHWLKFSPVEAHYYKRKHEGCALQFNRTLERVKADVTMKLSELSRETLSKLVHPLLSLRQACCHPQAVRGEFIRLNQSTMRMEDLLQSLISKAKLECEEAQRLLVCSINGQAAVHLIEGEVVSAVEKYREVLRNADEQKGKLKVDSLQILHAMHNLSRLLDEKHEGVAPTTRDGELKQQMEEMKVKYMGKALANLTACGQSLFPISEKITDLERKVKSKGPGWWLEATMNLTQQGLGEELILKIKDEAASGRNVRDKLVNRFQDCRGLQYVVQEEMETLLRCYKEAKAGVKKLSKPVTPELVSSTVDCHLRPFKGRAKNDCLFCKVEGALQEYEMRLFAFEQRDFLDMVSEDPPPGPSDSDDNIGNYTVRPRGTWAMSEVQKILKVLLSFFKQFNGDPWIVDEATQHLEMIEQMQKEFKPLRAYWGALMERVAAMDELDMAKMRLRVKLPEEPYDPESQPYIILPGEIESQKAKLLNDRFVANSELRKKMGQLVYLQNLEKAQYSSLEGSNPEPCPICTRPLGVQWAVLHCGHCYCCECMSVLQSRNATANMKCPVCREMTARKEVSFVSTEKESPEASNQAAIKVQGGHSTKVEAIVKTLIYIKRMNPDAKSLVFSAWQDVLNIVARALSDNHISYRLITQVGHKHFQNKLLDFKLDPNISTLLLPLNVACNGLNIIEATHVLLVEPILNPATELQAVGRVHRIGQTRQTVIHRFIVKQTIEEELHKYLQTNPLSNNITANKSETGDLTVDQLRGMLSFQIQMNAEEAAEGEEVVEIM